MNLILRAFNLTLKWFYKTRKCIWNLSSIFEVSILFQRLVVFRFYQSFHSSEGFANSFSSKRNDPDYKSREQRIFSLKTVEVKNHYKKLLLSFLFGVISKASAYILQKPEFSFREFYFEFSIPRNFSTSFLLFTMWINE